MQRYIPVLMTVGFLATSDLAYSQETTRGTSGKEFAVSGVLMLPQGDWIRPRLSIAGGGGFRALFPVASSLVSAGVDSQVLFYEEGPHGNEQVITVHGLLRAHLGRRARRPYVETVGGLKGFSVDPGTVGSYSYGVGAGMQLPIATRPPFGRNDREFIEMGVRYLRGGGVHLTPGRVATHTHSFMLYVGWDSVRNPRNDQPGRCSSVTTRSDTSRARRTTSAVSSVMPELKQRRCLYAASTGRLYGHPRCP